MRAVFEHSYFKTVNVFILFDVRCYFPPNSSDVLPESHAHLRKSNFNGKGVSSFANI